MLNLSLRLLFVSTDFTQLIPLKNHSRETEGGDVVVTMGEGEAGMIVLVRPAPAESSGTTLVPL